MVPIVQQRFWINYNSSDWTQLKACTGAVCVLNTYSTARSESSESFRIYLAFKDTQKPGWLKTSLWQSNTKIFWALYREADTDTHKCTQTNRIFQIWNCLYHLLAGATVPLPKICAKSILTLDGQMKEIYLWINVMPYCCLINTMVSRLMIQQNVDTCTSSILKHPASNVLFQLKGAQVFVQDWYRTMALSVQMKGLLQAPEIIGVLTRIGYTPKSFKATFLRIGLVGVWRPFLCLFLKILSERVCYYNNQCFWLLLWTSKTYTDEKHK